MKPKMEVLIMELALLGESAYFQTLLSFLTLFSSQLHLVQTIKK